MNLRLPTPGAPLRIGTRGSPLALAQAHETRDRLVAVWGLPADAFQVVAITTTGDRVQDRPLSEVGGKGLFTLEIEAALLGGSIDIAVHSMKDMPALQPEGLVLDTYLAREDVRDAFVSPRFTTLADLPQGARVGTSSLRRRAQILARRPDLVVVDFRGNVATRLRKLGEGVAAATFLAIAGLNRLGLDDVPARPMDPGDMLPAVAQGAIGIERRMGDTSAADLLAAIHDTDTGLRLAAERAYLVELDGSCQTPIAGLAVLDGGQMTISGEILRPDGSAVFAGQSTGALADGPDLGRDLARALLAEAGPDFLTP